MPRVAEVICRNLMRTFAFALLLAVVVLVSIPLGASQPQLEIVAGKNLVSAVQEVRPTANTFNVPVKISTYGDAWEGYLAFGLWDFPYSNASVLNPNVDVGGANAHRGPHNYFVVMTTKGQLLGLRISNVTDQSFWPVKYLGNDTLMYVTGPEKSTHFWNLKTNVTSDFPNVWGHHDMVYNPVTRTFLTLRGYMLKLDGRNVLMDKIIELNIRGDIIWTWDTYANGHFNLRDICPCNDTDDVRGETVVDLTHSNTVQWDFKTNTVLLNMRDLNTFCKINKTTGQTIWCLGEHGNFTLLGKDGTRVPSLWYHSHDVQEVQPDVFLMFDNDLHNTTMPCVARYEDTKAYSRMIEVTVNEQNRTAWVSWSWEAPRQDWSPYWSGADRLPNGDRIADFGDESHYLPGSTPSHPLPNSTGAVVIEVNQKGDVVRSFTFPYGWGIYRAVTIPLKTVSDYDGSMRTTDFNINLSTINDIGGPTSIHYKINNGPVKTVSVDGQPQITTQGTNNTLEYWSEDSNGIVESSHNILTGIELKSGISSTVTIGPSTGSTAPQFVSLFSTNILITIAAVAVLAVSFTTVMRKRRHENSK